MLGPLAGGVVSPILPEIAASVGSSTAQAAATLPAYLIPFAGLLLVSGTWGERWGRRRVVRWAYLVFVVGLLLAAVAQTLPVLLLARAIQGAANAFTTPLLLAGLSDMVPVERRVRALGVAAAFQGAGMSFAAVLGAFSAVVSWRLGFVLIALVSVVMLLFPPPGEPRAKHPTLRFRALLTADLLLLCLAGMIAFVGAPGIPFLVALLLQTELGVSTVASGWVLACFGVCGLVAAPACGWIMQRIGVGLAGVVGALGAGCATVLVGQCHQVGPLAVAWGLAGASTTLMNLSLTALTLVTKPANSSGALSVVASLRFVGGALAPVIWLPLLTRSTEWAFVGVGLATALTALPLIAAGRMLARRTTAAGPTGSV